MGTQGSSPGGDAPTPDRPTSDPSSEKGAAGRPDASHSPDGHAEQTPAYPPGRGTAPGVVPPSRPPDPIVPFLAPPLPRRRGRDWGILVFALVASSIIMAGCCIAGFAIYNGYGG